MNRHSIDDPTQVGCAKQRPTVLVGTVCDYLDSFTLLGLWGYENNEIIERVHTEFLRKITKTRKSTPLYMLYAELGRYPIQITTDTRIIKFWNKILIGKASKLSHILYQVLRTNFGRTSKWINHVSKIFEDSGKYNIWLRQSHLNNTKVQKTIKQRL